MGGGLQFLNTKSWHPSRSESFEEAGFLFENETVQERERLDEKKKAEDLKKMEQLKQLYDEELRKEARIERVRSVDLSSTPGKGSLPMYGSLGCMHICDAAMRATASRTSYAGHTNYDDSMKSPPTILESPKEERSETEALKKQLAAMEDALRARDAHISMLQTQAHSEPIMMANADSKRLDA